MAYKDRKKSNFEIKTSPGYTRIHGKDHPNSGTHRTEEQKKNLSKPRSKKGKINLIEASKKYRQEHPEEISKRIKRMLKESEKYWKEHPEERAEQIKNMFKAGKSTNTKIEIIVQEHVKILTDKPFWVNYPIHDYEYNKIYLVDILIPHLKTVIEVNGCYVHKCVDCHPLTNTIYEDQQKRIDDTERINFLRKYGFNVVVIWNHDIKNGKYKDILNKVLNSTI